MKNHKPGPHYINGHFIHSQGTSFTSIDPANNTLLWQGNAATDNEISAAYNAARQALPRWSSLDFSSRAEHALLFGKEVEKNHNQLKRLIAQETGKPLWEATTEVNAVIGKINLSIEAYQKRTKEECSVSADITNHLRYKPHGVMAVLGPFNFPAHLSNSHIIPALLAGNTVVYKPSELTPAVAEFVMQCFHNSGFPAGVINMVQGGGEVGKSLLEKDVQAVCFTGSYATGLKIHQLFSQKPEVLLALEMGGNNPLIIDDLNNINAAIYHTILSSFITAGQRCTCARRVMIPDNHMGDQFLKELLLAAKHLKVGAYTDSPEPFMGPVIHYQQACSLLNAQKRLEQEGGHTLLPLSLLKENTGLVSPGIIDMTNARTTDEEIFGPLIQIHRYHHFEDALQLANQTRYGLVAGLFSDSQEHYQLFYNTIRAGLINFNRPTTGAASHLPFGGVGISGNLRPSAYFAADYCSYPIASLEQSNLTFPAEPLPGITL